MFVPKTISMLLLIGLVLSTPVISFTGNESEASRDVGKLRPVLLYYVVKYGAGDKAGDVVQVDTRKQRSGLWFYYQSGVARWRPGTLQVAAGYDTGLLISKYKPVKHRFSKPKAISHVLGTNNRRYQIDVSAGSPEFAWSPDGRWLLLEQDPKIGLERVELSTGRREVIVPASKLGVHQFGNTRGADWSPDGKWIAYSVQGRDRATKGSYDPEADYLPDPGAHCDVWMVQLSSGKRQHLGHGSRPRFSRDGHYLAVVDRHDNYFGTGIRIYDLRKRITTTRWIVKDAWAACFAHESDQLAVVLKNGDLTLVSLDDRRVQRLLMTFKDVVAPLGEVPVNKGIESGHVLAANIDW